MAARRHSKKVEALILCIDRDDDLGKKAGIKGPVIGEDDNLKAAEALAMFDPEDTDVNAIFMALRTKHECDKDRVYKSTEIATLTGDKAVGVKSDKRILEQLQSVLERFKPTGVVFVSDGAEDDNILPLIQNETKVLSKRSVTVKQSKELEGAYFKFMDFLGKIGEQPRLARTVFALPGALLLLYAIIVYFKVPLVGEFIIGAIGLYLVAKGFGYEGNLLSGMNELRVSVLQGKVTKIAYLFSILLVALAITQGFFRIQQHLPDYRFGVNSIPAAIDSDPLLTLNWFLRGSLEYIIAAIVVASVGSIIHNFIKKKYLNIRFQLMLLTASIVAVFFLINNLYWYLLYINPDSPVKVEEVTAVDFTTSIIMSLVVIFVIYYLLKAVFFDYVARKQELEKMYAGKKAYEKKGGREMGAVTKISMRGSELQGVYIKRRFYPVERIHAKGDVVVINTQ